MDSMQDLYSDDEETSSISSPRLAHSSEVDMQRHLTDPQRYAESFTKLFPDIRIFVGTANRGQPQWEYEAQLVPTCDSPNAEFTPYGLDLAVLHLTSKVKSTSCNMQRP